jgi:hypothetical protein
MTSVQIESGTLIANFEDRTLSGLLVPYGEVGRTNLGRFTVEAGALTLPRDPSVCTLNSDHDRETPIGRATMLAEDLAGPEGPGIYSVFKFADTPEGDEALLAHEAGTKSALSVEAKNMVIRAGKAIAGHIFGAAHVTKGAFPSATLLAADVGDDGTLTDELVNAVLLEPIDGVLSIQATELPEAVVVTAGDSDLTFTPETPITESESLVAAATVPSTLTAAATTADRPLSVHQIGSLYAQRAIGRITDLEFQKALEGQNGNTLFAALSDVKYDGTGGIASAMTSAPQWLGQVWEATTYRQQVLPLFSHADLTSLTFTGFKWGTKPAGGDWAGNKGNVPSNTVTVSATPGTASRYAIGHDIAREFIDFPVDGFFESYAAAVSEDYARWADGKVAAAAIAGATVLAGDALTTLPGVTGGTIGSAASAIIDGATAIITAGSLPDFALVAPALWKQMAKMPTANVIGYLNASLGLSEGDLDGFTIRPSASIAAGKVLVGAAAAVTVLELPGAPVRIDALDLARGGIDKAAFGYVGVNVNDALGLQLVTAATA